MKVLPSELAEISARTLAHYDARAEDFREGTRDHDVSQNIAALLRHIAGEPPFAILDFGCGPGRDLQAFAALGHVAIGLEGAARFAAMARADSGCEVWQQDFLALDLPDGALRRRVRQRGAVPRPVARSCRACSRQLHATLKPGGVLFSSNPRGDERGRLEPRALRRLPRSRDVARLHDRPRASSSSSTTTGPPACRASSSRGWRACGAGPRRSRFPLRRPRERSSSSGCGS